MSARIKESQPIIRHERGLDLPNDIVKELLVSVLDAGAKFAFQAKGNSMLPFIQPGDKLVISPCEPSRLKVGQVVAYNNNPQRSLVVHRIIARNDALFLIKADNSVACVDGWIQAERVLGVVSAVYRQDKRVRAGIGAARRLVAWLSRKSLLTKLVRKLPGFFPD